MIEDFLVEDLQEWVEAGFGLGARMLCEVVFRADDVLSFMPLYKLTRDWWLDTVLSPVDFDDDVSATAPNQHASGI